MPCNRAKVYIVHAVDVEGPMTESLEATFERMRAFGLPERYEVSLKNLKHVQMGTLPGLDNTLAELLQRPFTEHLLGYWNTWNEIDAMLSEINSESFRSQYCGSDGSPYRLSWFIYDHHNDFLNNPRFHAIGTHTIFDHYLENFLQENIHKDGIYWHYHHPPVNGDALGYNTSWTSMPTHESIIASRIIEREFYFSVFRAGMHIERNDMSHWLEMFIPFDFSARHSPENAPIAPGMECDWRGCPDKWGGWHPDWYDYRKQGAMRRYLFRTTDLWTYLSVLQKWEVEQAFEQARRDGNSILTYYNHDYRDMRTEIKAGYRVIREVAERFPDVEYTFSPALEAAQAHLGLSPLPLSLSHTLDRENLYVTADSEIFGPQPFLAVCQNGRYFRDNFTQEGPRSWTYKIQYPAETSAIGAAACTPSGTYDLFVHRLV